MRVVSLVPAATEIVAALGLGDTLVGRSHDCDYPPEVAVLPAVTACLVSEHGLTSAERDRRVRETLRTAGTLYRIDDALVRSLRPDVTLTQALCDVCAVGYGSVCGLADTLPGPPRVVSLDPTSLDDVLGCVSTVGSALGAPDRADRLLAELRRRLAAVRAAVAGASPRRCVVIEWLDPLFTTGHWGPELVTIAGGVELVARAGERSREVAWEEIVAAAPDVLVVAPCGYPIVQTLAEIDLLRRRPGWDTLPAVRAGEVYLLDGGAYNSRPGPRLVDTAEIFAAIFHPDRVPLHAGPDAVRRLVATDPVR